MSSLVEEIKQSNWLPNQPGAIDLKAAADFAAYKTKVADLDKRLQDNMLISRGASGTIEGIYQEYDWAI